MNALTPAQAIPLVELHGERVVTDSLRVAAMFGKRHDNVLKAIRRLECSETFRRLNFEEMQNLAPTHNGGYRQQTVYELTRDGFTFLAMGFTGAQAAQWKEAYIAAFNRMEAELRAGDAKAREKLAADLARTQRQLITAQRALLAEARRRMREFAAQRPAPVPSAQMTLDLGGAK